MILAHRFYDIHLSDTFIPYKEPCTQYGAYIRRRLSNIYLENNYYTMVRRTKLIAIEMCKGYLKKDHDWNLQVDVGI